MLSKSKAQSRPRWSTVRLQKLKVSLESLCDMGDAQLKTTHLCYSLALPLYCGHAQPANSPTLPRCSTQPCGIPLNPSLAVFGYPEDKVVHSIVSDWSWLKTTLPSSRGGLNLRSALRHASAAYLASHTTSLPLVK